MELVGVKCLKWKWTFAIHLKIIIFFHSKMTDRYFVQFAHQILYSFHPYLSFIDLAVYRRNKRAANDFFFFATFVIHFAKRRTSLLVWVFITILFYMYALNVLLLVLEADLPLFCFFYPKIWTQQFRLLLVNIRKIL